MYSNSRYSSMISMVLLFVALAGVTFAQEEYVFYGDTIIGEYPPDGRGPVPETLVVLYTEGNDVSPPQPVPDFWQSIWDINLSTPFSITKYYKKTSYGASIIDAHPKAHWDGWWHYCFHVNYPTPPHGSGNWYAYCQQALIAADPEVNFADYAVLGQVVYVVVIACSPGGGSGIFWISPVAEPTNDTFPNGATVYVKFHYAYRLDREAMTHHFGLNIHEYNHNWLPDYYCNYYEMGSFCGHYGYGFCRYHAWVDWIPSPINPQWRYEIKDKNTLQPWLIPTEIGETRLDYPIMPMQETYGGEVIRITMNSAEQMLQSQSFIVTNHQGLAPFEENFPDSGLLVWHIRNSSAINGWDWYNRRRRLIDIECAHGLWQWDSTEIDSTWSWWPTTPDPVYGTDSLDMYNRTLGRQGVYPPITSPEWKGFGSATCIWDPETYHRFDAFTNPSSNLYDKWHGPLYPEYIHSHFALRNIRPDPIDETIVRADILLNYVQSDVITATSYNNSRNIVSDATGNIYMVYEAGGYVYFTSTHMNTMIWEPAYPVGEGKSPTIALDANNNPNIVWVRADTLLWAKRQNYYTWPREVLYNSPEDGYCCETPSFVIDNAGYGHVVFEEWYYESGSWSGLYYGNFTPLEPGEITWELIDFGTDDIRCQDPSIAVDNDNDPHAVWQKDDEIYYCERQDEEEPPWVKIENISNSEDHASRTPSVEIAANWVHVAWVEQPWLYNWSNVCHRRCDLSTGRWYKKDWVSNSQAYSESPQTSCGDQIVWSEEYTPGNYEIYHSTWNYETSSWGAPENIANTTRNSIAPQVAVIEDEESGEEEERCLVTIWCEDDGVLYEVRTDKRHLHEPRVKYYIDFGREMQSPYTLERDGYVTYGLEDYKNVDYGLDNIEYHITGFNSECIYPFKCMFYHENNNNLTLQIRLDDVLFRAVPIPPNQLVTREGIIPEILIQDGEITVNNVVMQGGPGVLSSVVIYEMRKPQTGGPQSLSDIEKSSIMFTIHPSVTSGDAHMTYRLGSPDWIMISVFDITGRKLKTLAEGYQPAGSYGLYWDRTDERGRRLGSGIYFVCLENKKGKIVQKFVVVN